ncbi:MAG: hypothetical protein IPG10_14140 [Flavobacteriales bacterium]|nr:hypothetical protein [Flavobacteriales bacterium]
MELPFTVDQFMAVFAAYNVAVWPAQILLYAVALLAVLLPFSKVARDGWIATVLGFLWLWMGIAYHWLHFASINKAAYAFGALFVLQGLLFLFAGQRGQLLFQRPNGLRGVLGIALLLYALIIYPMLGAAMGHVYPNAPSFGLPCPRHDLHPRASVLYNRQGPLVDPGHTPAMVADRLHGGDQAGHT